MVYFMDFTRSAICICMQSLKLARLVFVNNPELPLQLLFPGNITFAKNKPNLAKVMLPGNNFILDLGWIHCYKMTPLYL